LTINLTDICATLSCYFNRSRCLETGTKMWRW